MKDDLKDILLTEEEIQEICKDLGEQLTRSLQISWISSSVNKISFKSSFIYESSPIFLISIIINERLQR
jgi:hypoxanthine-guanine phosphoribosyltransferase